MSAPMALIKVTLRDESISFVPAFRASESIWPSDLKEILPAVLFRFESIHEIDEINFLSLHISRLHFSTSN
jgi:hypothetical protein